MMIIELIGFDPKDINEQNPENIQNRIFKAISNNSDDLDGKIILVTVPGSISKNSEGKSFPYAKVFPAEEISTHYMINVLSNIKGLIILPMGF